MDRVQQCWLITVLLFATNVIGESPLTVQTPYMNERGSGWFFFLASGSSGIYAADHRQNCIRRLHPDTGEWHDWVGMCGATSAGFSNGFRNTARFDQPQGICMHPRGHLLVADKGNHCIRQVTTQGSVSTYAGACGQAGDVDGAAQDALFSEVFDVQCLANCSVLVSEPGSGRVRLILDTADDCPTAAPAPPPGGRDHAHGSRMLWPLLIAAALTGAVVAAALMLWLNAHVARVHNRMHANIEEYQALNNHSQGYEAGYNLVGNEDCRQQSSILRAVPQWLGKLLPASMTEREQQLDAESPGSLLPTEQSGNLAQRTSAARHDALSQLRAKRRAGAQHYGEGQENAAEQNLQADHDVFHLFDGAAGVNSQNDSTLISEHQAQPGIRPDLPAGRSADSAHDEKQDDS